MAEENEKASEDLVEKAKADAEKARNPIQRAALFVRENLGLHRLLAVDSGDSGQAGADSESFDQISSADKLSEVENARMVLQAHENLVSIDESNKTKFQDVIAFLKNQVEGQ